MMILYQFIVLIICFAINGAVAWNNAVGNSEFVEGFRRFWAEVIEFSTAMESINDEGQAESFSENDISYLSRLFVNADSRYYAALVEEKSREELIDSAGLGLYINTLVTDVQPFMADILAKFWSDSLSDNLHRTILERMPPASSLSGNDDEAGRVARGSQQPFEENLVEPEKATSFLGRFYSYLSMKSWRRSESAEIQAQQGQQSISRFRQLYAVFSSKMQTTAMFVLRQFNWKNFDFVPMLVSLVKTIRHIFAHHLEITKYIDVEGVLLDPQIGLRLEMFPQSMQELFRSGVLGYFKGAGLENAGRICSGVLRLPVEAQQDNVRLLMTVFDRSGPAMQKLMQMMGDEAKNPELERFLDRLKDQIEPMTEQELQLAVKASFGDFPQFSQGYRPAPMGSKARAKHVWIRSLNLQKRVGSASIGEGWIGEIEQLDHDGATWRQRSVFIKFMRWNVRRRMLADIKFLKKLSKNHPMIKNPCEELILSLHEELDWELEIRNQIHGRGSYQNKNNGDSYDGIYVPEVIGLFLNGGSVPSGSSNNAPQYRSAAIISELADGVTVKTALTLDDIKPEHACQLGKIYMNFIGKWIRNIMDNRHRFAHGDPHAGNILVMFNPLQPKFSWLSILDWGNVVFIPEDTRARLVAFSAGLLARDESAVLNALGRGEFDKLDHRWAALKRDVKRIFEQAKQLNQLRKSKNSNNKKAEQTRQRLEADDTNADEFSMSSRQKQEQILNAEQWNFKDRLLELTSQITAAAVTNHIALPKGMMGFFRSLKFLDTTFRKIKGMPAFKESKCQVARKSTADAFFSGLMDIDIKNMVDIMPSAAASTVSSFFRNVKRKMKSKGNSDRPEASESAPSQITSQHQQVAEATDDSGTEWIDA